LRYHKRISGPLLDRIDTFADVSRIDYQKLKVISESLEHSSVAFTMDLYSHIIERMQQDAMARLDGVLPKAKKSNTVLDASLIIVSAAA